MNPMSCSSAPANPARPLTPSASWPAPVVQERELWITGAFRYAGTWPAAIALAATGSVDLDSLVTGHFTLEAVEQALTAGRRDPDTVKAVVRPGG